MYYSAVNNTSATPKSVERIPAILQTAHALEAKLETTLEQAGLSGAKYSVLSELVRSGEPLPLSELAARLSCVRSNMTQLVDRLESDGLVRRVSCPTDRRSVKAEITEEGTRRQADGAQRVDELERELASLLSGISGDALKQTIEALR
jgi:DNA-binding MarR family transcriptional regulator